MRKEPISHKIVAWLSIIRAGNAIALGYAAVVGYMLGGLNNLSGTVMLLLFVAAFAIGSSSNILNDYYDLPIDLINKPWRPLPSGLISAKTAYAVAIVLAIVGITASATISIVNGLIAFTAFMLSYAYSRYLKRMLILGNVTIAFLSCLTIVYGGVASKSVGINVIIASVFAFLLNLGREFIKGIEDIEGDRRFGVRTLAAVLGPKIAYTASVITFSVLICLSLLPYLLLSYSVYYLVLAVVGVDLTILVALVKASTLRSKDALRASRILKVAAFCGITAFFVEALKLHYGLIV